MGLRQTTKLGIWFFYILVGHIYMNVGTFYRGNFLQYILYITIYVHIGTYVHTYISLFGTLNNYLTWYIYVQYLKTVKMQLAITWKV
jgi:hypothetical protein